MFSYYCCEKIKEELNSSYRLLLTDLMFLVRKLLAKGAEWKCNFSLGHCPYYASIYDTITIIVSRNQKIPIFVWEREPISPKPSIVLLVKDIEGTN